MIDMHLDTYFNVASSGVAVGSETLLRAAKVDMYTRDGKGVYTRDPNPTDLYNYITGKGFEVIGITTLEQMAYATNFLCIRDGKILVVEVDQVVREVIGNLQAGASRDPGRYGKLLAQVGKDYRYLKSHGEFFPHKSDVYQHDIDAHPIILENLTGGYGGRWWRSRTRKVAPLPWASRTRSGWYPSGVGFHHAARRCIGPP